MKGGINARQFGSYSIAITGRLRTVPFPAVAEALRESRVNISIEIILIFLS